MKKFVLSIIALIFLSGAFYGQSYSMGAYYTQMQHKFDARAEAMGRGNAALTGNTFYMFDNPASTSFMDGGGISYTYLEPQLWAPSRSFVNIGGASFNTNKYGALGFIYEDYLEGKYKRNDINGNYLGESEIRFNTAAANYSYKIYNDLAAGITGRYYTEKIYDTEESAFLLDIGLLKKFVIANDQNIYAGLSISNISNSTFEFEQEDWTYRFPAMLRAAGVYEISYNPMKEKLTPLHITICAEYEDNLGSKYYTRAKFGGEVRIFERINLRAGHFTEFKEYSRNPFFPTGNISHLTYGFGFTLPLHKLFSIPIELTIDYTKQENTYYVFDIPEDFKLLTGSINLKL